MQVSDMVSVLDTGIEDSVVTGMIRRDSNF